MLIPFSPPPGLDSDETTFAAQGRWVTGDNMRFYDGRAEPTKGWALACDFSAITAQCRAIFASPRGGTNEPGIAYGFATNATAPKLYIRDPASTSLSTPLNVTPAALSTSTNYWSLAAFGGTLLAVPDNGTLYDQTGTSTAAVVAAAPDNITAMIVTPERQVLALGCNEVASGTFNGRCVRCSDTEDYSSAGSWTPTSTNNSDEIILEGGGNIVSGTVFGSYVVVWTTTSLWLGQFLGDPSQTYRFDKVDDNCGLLGPNAFVVLNKRLYWFGVDGLPRTWTVGELPQLLPFPIKKSVSLQIGIPITTAGSPAKMAAASISAFGEVRFYYPSGTSENSAYAAFCPATGAWYKGANGRTAVCENGLLVESSAQSAVLAVDVSNKLLREGTGNTGTGSTPYSWSIQSGDFYLDNSRRRVMIRSIIPDFQDQTGDVSLTLYVRDHPQSSPTTKGPYTLTAGAAKKDFRVSGKIISVKLSGASSTFARIGKCVFDIVTLGER